MSVRHRHACFAVWCLLAALANVGVVVDLIDLAQRDDAASHTVVVPFVAMAVLMAERRTVFSGARWAWLPGVVVAALAIALAVAARPPNPGGDGLIPGATAIVGLWIGGFLLVYGPRASRAALFPLALLGLAIPIPSALLHEMTTFLQWGSADATEALFRLTALSHFRDGLVFHLPNVVIWIAEECSGVRSTIGLLLTTLLAAHIGLKATWARVALLLALVPVALFKNAIRITVLSLLTVHVDPAYLHGWLHRSGGFIFFLIALAMVFGVLGLLTRLENWSAWARLNTAPAGEPG